MSTKTKPNITISDKECVYHRLEDIPEDDRKALKEKLLASTKSYFKTEKCVGSPPVQWDSWDGLEHG